MKIPLFLILISTLFFSCENFTSSNYEHSLGEVSTIFIVNGNQKATIGWKFVTDVSVKNYFLHRDTVANFAVKNSNLIATFNSFPKAGYVDTPIVNNKSYYYTVVTESIVDGTPFFSAPHFYAEAVGQDYSKIETWELNYSKHIQQIFNSGCAVSGCHIGGETFQKSQKNLHSGVFSLKNWNDVLTGGSTVSNVIPFRANKSHLVYHLNKDTSVAPVSKPTMPSEEINLPKEQIETIMKWINLGAKNDLGETAFNSIPSSGWAFVTSQGEDLVSVIDLNLMKIRRVVTAGVENVFSQTPLAPHNVTVDKKNQHYYVNLIAGNKILKFNVFDNTLIGSFSSEINSPAQVALSSSGDTAFVSNFEGSSQTITVFNTKTMSLIKTISDFAILKPHGVTITPDYKYALTANSFSDNISIISLNDLTILATIPVSQTVPALPINYQFQFEPYQIVVDSKSKFGYVTCKKSGEVRVIDIEQKKIVDSITVGSAPLIPTISDDDLFVYIPNRNSNSISIIDATTKKLLSTIENVGEQPHGVAISSDGKYLIVTLENLSGTDFEHHPTTGSKKIGKVLIIDRMTKNILKEIEVGNFAAGISITQK